MSVVSRLETSSFLATFHPAHRIEGVGLDHTERFRLDEGVPRNWVNLG